MFSEQLPDRLNFIDSLSGFVCLVGNMNIHFDNPLQSLTKQTLTTLCLNSLVQFINKTTHRCGTIIHWLIVRPDDDIHRNSTVTDSHESDHYCAKYYFNVSVSKPSTLYRIVRNMANIDRPTFIAELTSVSEFLLTVLDKHEPPSLRKVINHNSLFFSPCILRLCLPLLTHSIIHHSFADDLQLQMSAPPYRISELLHSIQSCICDVKVWATANMLKLNDSKTELMLVTSMRSKHLHNLPTSITIGNAQIPFKQSVKFGFYIGLSSYYECTCLQYCSDMLL